MWVEVSSKDINFSQFEISLLQARRLVPTYGHMMLPGAFPDKVTPDIDFADQRVVQCGGPVVKLS